MKVKINKVYYKVVLHDFVLPVSVGRQFGKEIEVPISDDEDSIFKSIVVSVASAYVEEYCLLPRVKTNNFLFNLDRFCDLMAWYGKDIIETSKKIYDYVNSFECFKIKKESSKIVGLKNVKVE